MGSLVSAETFPRLGTLGADRGSLLGLPTPASAKKRLPVSADDVLKSIFVIVDELLRNVVSKRTAAEFTAATTDAFPKYVDLIMAFGRVATATMPPETIARLSAESLSELEVDIRQHGVACFGSAMRDRAGFTVFTLRKIAERLDTLSRLKCPDADQHKDMEFSEHFLVHALRSRFHVDCLVTSMRTRQPLFPEVLPLVDDGLRSAVNAYAWVKRAVDLRTPPDTREIPDYLTAEDEELVNASMADLATEDET